MGLSYEKINPHRLAKAIANQFKLGEDSTEFNSVWWQRGWGRKGGEASKRTRWVRTEGQVRGRRTAHNYGRIWRHSVKSMKDFTSVGEKVMWGPAGKMGGGVGRAWLMEILLCQTEVWTWHCVEWRTSKDFTLEDSRIGFAWWKDNSGQEDLMVVWRGRGNGKPFRNSAMIVL